MKPNKELIRKMLHDLAQFDTREMSQDSIEHLSNACEHLSDLLCSIKCEEKLVNQ